MTKEWVVKGRSIEEIFEEVLLNAEREFRETVIEQYPFVLVCRVPDEVRLALEYIDRATALLSATNEASTYVAFPTYAMGCYKECSNNVYFKDETALLMFKLAFDPETE